STVQVRKKVNKEGKGFKEEVTLQIKLPRAKAFHWEPGLLPNKVAYTHFERFLPFLTRIGAERWRHDHTGEILTATDLLDTYADHLPPEVSKNFYDPMPAELQT
ncbi:hypothetical protein, partial [Rhizobium ecuadorense]